MYRLKLVSFLLVLLLCSCGKDSPYEPSKEPQGASKQSTQKSKADTSLERPEAQSTDKEWSEDTTSIKTDDKPNEQTKTLKPKGPDQDDQQDNQQSNDPSKKKAMRSEASK